MNIASEDDPWAETHWSPCFEPERPPDDLVIYCGRPCTACRVAVEALLNGLNPLSDRRECLYYAEVLEALT